jgi:hypothetical protein
VAATAGATGVQRREWTDEECDERSCRSRALNLGQYLHTGYRGPRWTAEKLALLGTMPDAEVAAKVGRAARGGDGG